MLYTKVSFGFHSQIANEMMQQSILYLVFQLLLRLCRLISETWISIYEANKECIGD